MIAKMNLIPRASTKNLCIEFTLGYVYTNIIDHIILRRCEVILFPCPGIQQAPSRAAFEIGLHLICPRLYLLATYVFVSTIIRTYRHTLLIRGNRQMVDSILCCCDSRRRILYFKSIYFIPISFPTCYIGRGLLTNEFEGREDLIV